MAVRNASNTTLQEAIDKIEKLELRIQTIENN